MSDAGRTALSVFVARRWLQRRCAAVVQGVGLRGAGDNLQPAPVAFHAALEECARHALAAVSADEPHVVPAAKTHTELWVYQPAPSSSSDAKPPLVLIAPAGSNALTGMARSVGDRVEHLPWVKATCVVVASELRGAPDEAEEGSDAFKIFAVTRAGVTDGMAELGPQGGSSRSRLAQRC